MKKSPVVRDTIKASGNPILPYYWEVYLDIASRTYMVVLRTEMPKCGCFPTLLYQRVTMDWVEDGASLGEIQKIMLKALNDPYVFCPHCGEPSVLSH